MLTRRQWSSRRGRSSGSQKLFDPGQFGPGHALTMFDDLLRQPLLLATRAFAHGADVRTQHGHRQGIRTSDAPAESDGIAATSPAPPAVSTRCGRCSRGSWTTSLPTCIPDPIDLTRRCVLPDAHPRAAVFTTRLKVISAAIGLPVSTGLPESGIDCRGRGRPCASRRADLWCRRNAVASGDAPRRGHRLVVVGLGEGSR